MKSEREVDVWEAYRQLILGLPPSFANISWCLTVEKWKRMW